MKKEYDRKIGLRYNEDIDSFDERSSRIRGKVTAAIAKAFAACTFEKYRVIQDPSYQSDFDRLMEAMIQDWIN